MPDRRRSSCLVAVAACLLWAGCGRSGSAPEPSAPAQGEQATRPTETAAAAPDANDPAAAFARTAADLAAGRAEAVVAAVPESYRRDLDRRLGEAVRSVDPAARREAAEAVARLAEVLRDKQEFVLGSERVALEGRAAEFVRRRFGPVMQVIATTARWPGWGEAGEIDSASLLKKIVAAVAAEPELAEAVRGLRFDIVSHAGERAVVRVWSPGEGEGVEMPVVLVKGNWVPAAIADRWAEMFPTDGKGSPVEPADRERRLRESAGRLRDVTAALETVTSQAEFDALADRAATALLAAAGQADPGPRPVRPEEFVIVVVLGELTEDEKDRLLWELASRSDAPSSGLADATDRPEGDGIRVTVGPVADVEAFAKRLAGVAVEQVDPQTRTITARIGGP